MNDTHPTDDQLDRFRRRTSPTGELLDVDAHIAECDRCFDAVRTRASSVVLPAEEHLTYAELEAFVDGRADLTDREVVESHTAACGLCRAELTDLARVRDSMRAPSRPAHVRWLAAAAVILAFILGAAWLFRPDASQGRPAVVQTAPVQPEQVVPRTEPETPVAVALSRPAIVDTLQREERVLRGPAKRRPFALQAPVATVVIDDRPRFRWSPAKDAKSYDVAVADAESGSVAASGSSDTNWWRPDMPLPRGRTYSWQVTAHTSLETIVIPGTSGVETLFHVAANEVVAEIEKQQGHLDRGVALAQHGALDEAEEELQLAAGHGDTRATELLEQVRAWRGDAYRALPTTTNGAQ